MWLLFFFNFYLENNVEYSSFLVSDEVFYLFRQYDNQKELHRSHLVSTKTGGTLWGVGINILAYSYLLVHFLQKKKKKDKTIINCSKIILRGLMIIFFKEKISAWYCVKQYERKKETKKQKK